MIRKKIKNLEKNYYRTTEVSFYTFLRWYEDYIEDVTYERKSEDIFYVYNRLKKSIGYIFSNCSEDEKKTFYIDKNYFDIMVSFDFENTLPRQTREIIKTEKNGKQIQQLKTTKYKM